MQVSIAVTTCPRRDDISYLSVTLSSLKSAGFETPLIVNDPGPVLSGPYRNLRRALTALLTLSPTADAYIVAQDDVLVAKGLRGFLERSLWPGEADNTGACSAYVSKMYVKDTPGWHRKDLTQRHGPDVRQPWTECYGALFYAFTPHFARAFNAVDIRPGNRTMAEMVVGEFCQIHNLGYWEHSPSLVEHIGEVSAIHELGINDNRRAGEWCNDVSELETRA